MKKKTTEEIKETEKEKREEYISIVRERVKVDWEDGKISKKR